jgi:hypothetical protein
MKHGFLAAAAMAVALSLASTPAISQGRQNFTLVNQTG